MSKNILLAVDTASHDPARHVAAAAEMTRDLSRDSGDHVIVLHVHEFATGRFGRIQVDCGGRRGRGRGREDRGRPEGRGRQRRRRDPRGQLRAHRGGHLARGPGPRRAPGGARLAAAVPTCPAFRSAAWPAGCCTWPPARSSSCPGPTPTPSRPRKPSPSSRRRQSRSAGRRRAAPRVSASPRTGERPRPGRENGAAAPRRPSPGSCRRGRPGRVNPPRASGPRPRPSAVPSAAGRTPPAAAP